MATGDKMCFYCNQWRQNCKCGWAEGKRDFPPYEFARDWMGFSWVTPESKTAVDQSGMYTTTVTTTTYKPRKRRHYRQVVY